MILIKNVFWDTFFVNFFRELVNWSTTELQNVNDLLRLP